MQIWSQDYASEWYWRVKITDSPFSSFEESLLEGSDEVVFF